MGGGGGGGLLVTASGAPGGIGFGGMIMGYEAKLSKAIALDFELLVGGGGGTVATGSTSMGGSVALEPQLAFVVNPGGSARATVTAGYLYMPMSPSLSAITASIRIDFKNLTLTYPYEE